MGGTFFLTMIAWVFFRSETVSKNYSYLYRIISEFSFPKDNKGGIIFIFIVLIFEWSFRKDERNPINFYLKSMRWLTYVSFLYLIFMYFKIEEPEIFIYFNF
jgi:hypothetical protein